MYHPSVEINGAGRAQNICNKLVEKRKIVNIYPLYLLDPPHHHHHTHTHTHKYSVNPPLKELYQNLHLKGSHIEGSKVTFPQIFYGSTFERILRIFILWDLRLYIRNFLSFA